MCTVVDCCEDLFEGPFDCREMKKCCFRCNPAVVLYSLYHWLTGFVYGVYRPFLFYVLYEQLPANSRFLLLGCLLATEVVVDYASDYLLFVVQRTIKDRRGVLFLANVFDILSCACYFFINEVHWALIFAGAALHSLAASMSIRTHRAIVAWWLVETDSTKYRGYFLQHRRRYELLGSFAACYWDTMCMFTCMMVSLKLLACFGRFKKVGGTVLYFLLPLWYTCLKLWWSSCTRRKSFCSVNWTCLKATSGNGSTMQAARPVTNPVADGAMEGKEQERVHGAQSADFPGENCLQR